MLGRKRPAVTRHRERYAAIHVLLEEGHSKTEIARRPGIGRETVGRFTRAQSIEEVLFKSTHRLSALDGSRSRPGSPAVPIRRGRGHHLQDRILEGSCLAGPTSI
ncbi:helix-turn-helix domain-containing protein [Sinosporangium siamense]|uniref:helix-turn-helix domain-containing protein n=1 Tax=Sinosporangium siamense TaxID=1367973 RepID=UPI0035EDDCB8